MAFVTRRAIRRVLEKGYDAETLEPRWWLRRRSHMWSLGLVVVEPTIAGNRVAILAVAPITADDLATLTDRLAQLLAARAA